MGQGSRDMRHTAKNSIKQGLWAGAGAVTGAMLLGPVGGLVGGVTGSLVGFMRADEYDGVVQQLVQLPAARQSRLVRAIKNVLANASSSTDNDLFGSPEAFGTALSEYANRRSVREHIWRLCQEALDSDEDASSPETVLTS